MQDTRDFLKTRQETQAETRIRLVSDYGPLLRHVDTVQEFTDILVPYTTDTLDRCSCRKDRSAYQRDRERGGCVPDWETLEMSLPSRISSSF